MPRVVYIVALSHSGSTLVDLLLGCNPKVISLGEVKGAMESYKKPNRICTCGSPVDKCIFWGRFRECSQKTTKETYIEKYRKLLDIAGEVYGDDIILVDSSKNLLTLEYLLKNNLKNIQILFLWKDIRSFVISQNSRRNIPRMREKDGWKRIYKTSTIYNVDRWYRGNRRTQNFLRKNNLKHFQFGYEELCFAPERILKQICDFIEITYEEKMLYPKNSERHILRGNQMRHNPKKLESIKYDHRWVLRSGDFINNCIFLPFLNWNVKNVYRNLLST